MAGTSTSRCLVVIATRFPRVQPNDWWMSYCAQGSVFHHQVPTAYPRGLLMQQCPVAYGSAVQAAEGP